jgi:UDP-glucose 4-epimerase
MKVLVVGGAGYIGSHMLKSLSKERHHVVALDDLSRGKREAVLGSELVEASLAERSRLGQLFAAQRFDAVMHFASFIEVSESVSDPAKYYRNNVCATLNLLDEMIAHGVTRFIFSSTAAIFGEPRYIPIDEAHPKQPLNPYGVSKLMVEQILADYERAYGLKSICLRYFNAAGADPDGELGESHDPETHLIPLVLQAASGRREAMTVFGQDYDTPDGTCIRDFIHVVDLCQAHLLALQKVMDGGESDVFNLGSGQGFSVRQVLEIARRVTGTDLPARYGPRRLGDPARLVADSAKAKKMLGWKPQFDELAVIIAHAWNREQKIANREENNRAG